MWRENLIPDSTRQVTVLPTLGWKINTGVTWVPDAIKFSIQAFMNPRKAWGHDILERSGVNKVLRQEFANSVIKMNDISLNKIGENRVIFNYLIENANRSPMLKAAK